MPKTNGKGTDGRRGPSIRRSLYLLVAVPLLTVIGLYGFVLYTTVGDAINLDRAPALINATSVPAAQFDINIQNERKASMVFLAAPTAANKAQLAAAQNATTAALPSFRAKMTGAATTDAATTAELAVIHQMLTSIQGLNQIRPAITARAIDPVKVFGAFSNILTEELQLFVKENASLTNAPAATSSLAVINSTESAEFMSQEDALVSESLAAHALAPATRIQVTQLAGARQAMFQATTSRLSSADLAVFSTQLNKYAPASVQSSLTQLENAVAADTTPFPPFTAAQWNPVLKSMSSGTFFSGVDAVRNQVEHDHQITNAAWRRVALSGGLGLLGLILSVLLSVLIGRRIVRRLDRLQGSVETLANQELPDVVARLRRGEDVPVEQLASTTSDLGKDEIGRVGRAFDAARRTAVEAAVGEARMRRGINDVFRNLARRNQSLLHRELNVLDGMERRTTDPETLEDLFRLDHLTTRMRRHSEGLIILSGAAPGRGWVHPVRMVDVLRAAAAEVEDYSRVTVTTPSQAALTGPAVADVIHLLAELIENATTLSPPYTPVRVSGDMVASGFAAEVEDRGLGMSEARYAELNHRLAEPPEFDVFNSEQLGLFVVGQLAKRHGIKVTLRPSPYGGTSAIALIPTSLVGTDEGFMEGLPAGASAATSAFPAQEEPGTLAPPGPAQLTGAPAWGALPQGNGHGNGSNGTPAAVMPDGPDDPFESYPGNGGPPAFGWMTPPAERSPFDDREEAPPFGTVSDGPAETETGLPWPYDRPAPAGAGIPSFTPSESFEPPRPSFTPSESFEPNEPPRPSFTPSESFEPPYQPPQPQYQPPQPQYEQQAQYEQQPGEPVYPAAESQPPAPRADSGPSLPALPVRRRSTRGPDSPLPQFTPFSDEQPRFAPEPPVAQEAFADSAPANGAHADGAASDGGHGDVDEPYKGLPRRVRQANLAPQLRDAPATADSRAAAASGDNVANRSPDDIRSALSAMQRGWQQGRSVTEGGTPGDNTGTGSVASGHLPSGQTGQGAGDREGESASDEVTRGGTDDNI